MINTLNFQENAPLKDLTTIKIGLSKARFLVTLTERDQVPELYKFAQEHKLPVLILGEGSNSIATDQDVEAVVVINRITGFAKQVISDDEIIYTVGGGEILDQAIEKMLQDGLGGIESLSGIPGTAGSAPVQNVGAYGQEIANTLVELEAYDTKTNQFVTLSKQDCGFGYRDGIFKTSAKNRYFITSITVKLTRVEQKPPFYTSLQKYIDDNNLTDFRPIKLREYIIAVRNSKIPNYKEHPSAGSMFKNAIISKDQLAFIEQNFGEVPFAEPIGDLVKIPTGWLIDKAGLKGKEFHGMQVDPNNALILVNKSASTFAEFEQAIGHIKKTIFDKFKVEIELEPIIIAV